MKNQEIAKVLYKIADILEIQGVEWKPRAYRRAAQSIEILEEAIEDVYKEGKLEDIPGVGKNIAKKIEEILKTGHLKYLSKLNKKVPSILQKLMNTKGIGPKTVKLLQGKLKIKTINDLKKAIKQHKIRNIKGFGIKTEQSILDNIKELVNKKRRFPLKFVLPIALKIRNKLKRLKYVQKVDVAGSVRRKKETVHDIDILVATKEPKKVIDFFVKLKDVKDRLAKGTKKASVKLNNGLQVDLRVVDLKNYGSALQYSTGSKLHSIKLRKIAIKKGLKLSEYGVFRGKKQIAGKTEKEVYNKLGLKYIRPELREDKGEIEAASKK